MKATDTRKRILTLLEERELFEAAERIFRRADFEVHRAPTGRSALLLAGGTRYDLVLLEAGRVEVGLQRFLGRLRSERSQSAAARVVILAPAAHVGPLSGALGDALAQVLAAESAPRELPRAVSAVLGVAARAAGRLLVQVCIRLSDSAVERIFQTENVSESGMLLRGTPFANVGTRVQVRVSLPEDSRPVSGEAEVVRSTDPRKEGVSGVAIRFLRLEGDGGERLRDYIAARRSQPGGGATPGAEGRARAAGGR